VLVHPESPANVVALADVVGSTTQIIDAAVNRTADTFIVATDNGILHKMRAAAPGKRFIEAPTAGNSATCKSCAHCPWMAMNGLQNLADLLENMETGANEIHVDPAIGQQAVTSITRMLDFAAAKRPVQPAPIWRRRANCSMESVQHEHPDQPLRAVRRGAQIGFRSQSAGGLLEDVGTAT
jgi:quinolinate synthase